MRFGGVSSKGKGKACMRSLREQYVFRAGYQIVPPREEFVISNIISTDRPPILARYYVAVSKEKIANPWMLWTVVFGVVNKKHELVPSEVAALIKEVMGPLTADPKYENLRWHDVAVLMLVATIHSRDPLGKVARELLDEVARLNPEMTRWYKFICDGR